jgi:hypothetical protein
MQKVSVSEEMFQGAVSLERGDGWIKPWRLPHDRLGLFPPDQCLPAKAGSCAGIRLRFETDSETAGLEVLPSDQVRPFDIVISGELVGTTELDAKKKAVLFEQLPSGTKTVEIWLPQGGNVTAVNLLLDDGASLEIGDDSRPRWVTYGSSITHCTGAHSPARTWPGLASRLKNINLTCLGFGGDCHMDPMIGRVIRDLPADLISLKLGINVCGGSSLSPRTFRPAIIGLVKTVRDGHPETPIAVLSSIVGLPWEENDNAVGLNLTKMRREVENAVERLQKAGDGNIRYFDGRLMLDREDADACLLEDGVHPNGHGYEMMGQRFAERVLSEYGY